MTLFHASLAQTCNAPSRWFGEHDRDRALSYAKNAAAAFRIAFCVYVLHGGRPRLVKRFAAPERGDHGAADR
jgi:hypothetical protein